MRICIFISGLKGLTLGSICYSPPGLFLDFAREFVVICNKKRAMWWKLSTGLAYTKTIIHLSVGEEW